MAFTDTAMIIALNIIKDIMGFIASAIFLAIPLKLWRLYITRLKIENLSARAPTLSKAIESWKKQADSIIQSATVKDFVLVVVALVLSATAAALSLFLSVSALFNS